jgi:hypothetical protein
MLRCAVVAFMKTKAKMMHRKTEKQIKVTPSQTKGGGRGKKVKNASPMLCQFPKIRNMFFFAVARTVCPAGVVCECECECDVVGVCAYIHAVVCVFVARDPVMKVTILS